jgi:hypothetical protein
LESLKTHLWILQHLQKLVFLLVGFSPPEGR